MNSGNKILMGTMKMVTQATMKICRRKKITFINRESLPARSNPKKLNILSRFDQFGMSNLLKIFHFLGFDLAGNDSPFIKVITTNFHGLFLFVLGSFIIVI